MKGKEWLAVISIVVIVAVVASLLTSNLTGNVITLNQDKWGKYKAYTTQETDTLLSKKIGAINLESCTITHSGYIDPTSSIFKQGYTPCNEICASQTVNNKCSFGFLEEASIGTSQSFVRSIGYCQTRFGGSMANNFADSNYIVKCVCCKP